MASWKDELLVGTLLSISDKPINSFFGSSSFLVEITPSAFQSIEGKILDGINDDQQCVIKMYFAIC